ncbi:MAG: sugar ABC transporter permease [Anaerolineae bacterium]|nr:sugar ABC transporter permease [Anaerolineae bacterium]
MAAGRPIQSSAGRGRVHLTQRRREALVAYALISPWFIAFLVFTAGAMVYSFGLSLFRADFLTPARFVGLGNYTRWVQDEMFGLSLYNTVYMLVFSIGLGMPVSLAASLLLNLRLRGIAFFRTVFYMPALVSGVATFVLWNIILNKDFGLLNWLLGLAGIAPVPWLTTTTWAKPALVLMNLWAAGGGSILYLAALQAVPQELYESASIDGAGRWSRFRHVTLPQISPTIFLTLVTGIIGGLQVFLSTMVMTDGGPYYSTTTYMLVLYRTAWRDLRWGYASAMAWLLFAIIMLLTLLVFRSSAAWVYYEGELRR